MKRVATIQTPLEFMSARHYYTDFCISFWSYVSQPDGVISFDLGFYGPDGQGSLVLYSLENITETNWTPHYINISKTIFNKYPEFNFLITASTENVDTIVAIDDIELTRDGCSFKSKFRCTDNQIVDMSKRCDFRKDCSDGLDEFNCGTCNFEDGR